GMHIAWAWAAMFGLAMIAALPCLFMVLLPAVFGLGMLLLAHYSMVVEEIGIDERDELPRPLRNFHLYEDMLAPAMHLLFALGICYWPLVVIVYLQTQAVAWLMPAEGIWVWLLISFI